MIHNILVSGELLQVFDKGSKLEQEEQINAADLDYLLLMVFVTKIRKKKYFAKNSVKLTYEYVNPFKILYYWLPKDLSVPED